MILTCPACGTKYVVKEGAIPPGGRQVRCASCKHSWHQDPEGGAAAEAPAETLVERPAAPAAEAETPEPIAASDEPAVGAAPSEPAGEFEPAAPPERDQWVPTPGDDFRDLEQEAQAAAPPADEFDPFPDYEPAEQPKRRFPRLILLVLAVAIVAAALWFLAPPQWRERLGLAAISETPLEVMVTNNDRQKLASGNELFAVSGRVINPTDRSQRVPPLRAELLDATKKRVVYSWTIAPPAATLGPGASASFNSAEVDVPEGGSHLRVTLGEPAA